MRISLRSPVPLVLAVLFVSGLFFQASAQESSTLRGTVMDAQTGAPVSQVILRVTASNATAVTDDAGSFVLRGLVPGSQRLQLTHSSYGTLEREINLTRAGETFELLIHIAAEGMTVEIVDAQTAVGAPPLEPPTAPPVTSALAAPPGPRGGTVVGREQIQAAAGANRNLGEVIRQTVPSLRSRQVDLAGATLCLEFRGSATRSMMDNTVEDRCYDPLLWVNGVQLSDPASAYSITALDDVEWIQALSPAEAGAQYGAAPYGVILIATTAGGARMGGMGMPSAAFVRPYGRRSFDWSQEAQGHPTLRTLGAAAAGNLVGLAAGVAVGRQCVYIEERTSEVEYSCGTAGVVGVSLAAVALPALGSALAAHWAGRTEGSTGKLVPTILAAGMMIFPGYVFSLATVGDGVTTMNVVGNAVLVVGTPILVTLADRMYRKIRN